MHERHFEGRISAICDKLRDKFPWLTPFDLVYKKGDPETFMARLSGRLNMTRTELGAVVLNIINEIINEPLPGRDSE